MEDKFDENNPQFIGMVYLLDEMCRTCFLGRDPRNRNNIIIYRKGVRTEDGDIVDGWFSQSVFSAAKELTEQKESFESLCSILKTKGVVPVFTKNGEFKELARYKSLEESVGKF